MSKLEVYKNLRKNCYSVRYKGRVIHYAQNYQLRNCKFVVQPAGRKKVIETGHKNVHAFVRGLWCRLPKLSNIKTARKVRYNPFKMENFEFEDGSVCFESEFVWLTPEGVYVV